MRRRRVNTKNGDETEKQWRRRIANVRLNLGLIWISVALKMHFSFWFSSLFSNRFEGERTAAFKSPQSIISPREKKISTFFDVRTTATTTKLLTWLLCGRAKELISELMKSISFSADAKTIVDCRIVWNQLTFFCRCSCILRLRFHFYVSIFSCVFALRGHFSQTFINNLNKWSALATATSFISWSFSLLLLLLLLLVRCDCLFGFKQTNLQQQQ